MRSGLTAGRTWRKNGGKLSTGGMESGQSKVTR